MKKSEKGTRLIKFLAISIGSYIVVALLLIGLVAVKDWTRLWQILTTPSVYVVLLAFLVVNIIIQVVRVFPRLEYIGVTVVIVGIAALIVHSIAGPQIIQNLTYDLVGFGAGTMGVGVGMIGIGMAQESNKRMEAMAGLQFDQALSALVDYFEPAESWKDKYYHARGALRFTPWATEEMKREIKRVLIEVKRQAQADKDTGGLVSKIEELWSQYGIDKWPGGDSLPNTPR